MTEPDPITDAEVEARANRSGAVRAWWSGEGRWTADERPPVGLALSGGGIRSATFSLGLIQALAKSSRDALGRIDVLSTVSGGGYAGCFYRSLFVPARLRGIDAKPAAVPIAETADQYRLARAALASDPGVHDFAWPPGDPNARRMRNPVYWLREHSRYLAPSGMTDFGFAIAYIARNWLAMVYLVLLACTGLGALLVGVEAAAVRFLHVPLPGWLGRVPLPPVLWLGLLPVAVSGGLMIAYWATQAMSTNEAQIVRQRASLRKAIGLILLAAAASAGVLALADAADVRWPGSITRLGGTFVAVVAAGIGIALAGVVIAWALARSIDDGGALLTTELRRRLTGALAWSNGALVIILAVALVDSLGAWLAWWLRRASLQGGIGAALLPVLAFVIKKLPDWFGGGNGRTAPGGGIAGLLKRFANAVAAAIGLLLYTILAIAALALVHAALWTNSAWEPHTHWTRWLALAVIAWVLGVVLGQSTGFINLSSLHALYASRLTRAYLGASNVARLRQVFDPTVRAAINENHPADYIQPAIYGGTDLPAPIHLINVTLNETIDPASQLVSRDRKGDMLSVEPDGVRIRDCLTRWPALVDPAKDKVHRAENISLGQWIAISGAAASAAMGRMTSLGFALAFTFANVRLGYWWWSPKLCPEVEESRGFYGWMGRNFGTFVYLFNEMTCRYSRGYYRKYLTDGGHYENSGAFVLIRRRVPLILVTDNGADPDYAFADLESLVRQVRIDLGAETRVLGGPELTKALTRLGATEPEIFVDPETHADWRKRMLDPTTPAYVLVLEVVTGGETLTVIWVKPRLLPDVPTDVAGYQLAMPAFPQQPTGDQFFDEAQWESYRRLGELSMTRLLDACPLLLADQPADEDEVGGLVDVDRGEPVGAGDHRGGDARQTADPADRIG